MKISCFFTYSDLIDNIMPERSVVVIDTLRATATFACALQNGAKEIIPVKEISEAMELKSRLSDVVLAGERKGLTIDGFDLGNSPREFTAEKVKDKTIVSCTTNGTAALQAISSHSVKEILTSSLINNEACAAYLAKSCDDLLILCAGTQKRPSLDDIFCAGELIDLLCDDKENQLDDAAQVARLVYINYATDPLKALRKSAHGKVLIEVGHGDDLAFIANYRADLIPCLQDGRLKLLK